MSKASPAVLLVAQCLLVSHKSAIIFRAYWAGSSPNRIFCKRGMKSILTLIQGAADLQVGEETSRVRGRRCSITGKVPECGKQEIGVAQEPWRRELESSEDGATGKARKAGSG